MCALKLLLFLLGLLLFFFRSLRFFKNRLLKEIFVRVASVVTLVSVVVLIKNLFVCSEKERRKKATTTSAVCCLQCVVRTKKRRPAACNFSALDGGGFGDCAQETARMRLFAWRSRIFCSKFAKKETGSSFYAWQTNRQTDRQKSNVHVLLLLLCWAPLC